MRKSLLFLFSSCIVFTSCDKEISPEFKELDQGIFYQVEAFDGAGEKVNHGDMVIFIMSVFQGADYGWTNASESIIQCDTSAKGLKGLLNSFEKEDSLSIRILPNMLAYDFGSRLDTSLGYGAIRLKIKEVYPSAQWNSDLEAVERIKRGIEQNSIEDFLCNDSSENPFIFQDGMYSRILEKNSAGPLASGVEIKVLYECYALDGRLIDAQGSDSEEALWYQRGQKGALIPGMEIIVMTMDRADVMEVIMPSKMAYGKKGVPEAGIDPWTPLRFLIRLKTVNAI